ncbi:MAG: hypothetical protein KF851_05655 [Pirellulaceae bacterium]|jgi:hypothetical protein|nr:hypothetical protein [Pirellulaceae bacterium]
MNLLIGTWATLTYELKRALQFQRMVYSCILALFPPVMIFFLGWGAKILAAQPRVQAEPIEVLFDALPGILIILVAVVGLLSLLLWATTNVNSELEGNSWIFVAVRSQGRLAILLGKYLASAFLAFAICETAILLSLLVIIPGVLVDPTSFWLSLTAIIAIGCLVYSATLSLIGVVFYRRALVIGAGYIIVFELILPNVPSLICNFTARRHLFDLGIRWIGWFLPGDDNIYRLQYGWHPLWINLAALAGIAIFSLLFSMYWIRGKEYISAEEA